MKQDARAKKLAALLKKIAARKTPEEAPPRDASAQMVVAFLQWRATRRQAEAAFEALLAEMVDINELRVSHLEEVLHVLGDDYPLAEQRMLRMREALNEVFRREHGIAMASIESKSKKEQRSYLETLPGITPYVVSQVMLLAFGGHAIPVDEKLVALLAREGVAEADDTPPAEVESYLLRQIKAGEAADAHLLLQAWSDSLKTPAVKKAASPAAKPAAASRSTKKKSTKKKPASRAAGSVKKKKK